MYDILFWPVVLIATLGTSYYGSKFLLPEMPEIEPCNYEMQGFEMRKVPIYWQVEKGQCSAGDPNFDQFANEIERILASFPTDQWPTSECVSEFETLSPYAVKYGSDFDEVEELDCKQQLEAKIKKAEDEFDLAAYLKSSVKQNSGNIGTNMLMKFLGGR